jgi:TonB family protein
MRGCVALALLVAAGCAHPEPAPAPPPPSNASTTPAPPEAHKVYVIPAAIDVTSSPPPPDPVDAMKRRIGAVYTNQLVRCYKNKLKQDPTVEGKIVLHLVVDERGHVTDARAAGPDDELDRCFEDAMRTWSFDAPGARTEFEVTINLAAN